MDDGALNAILEKLPKAQRDLARRKIVQAVSMGWQEEFIRLDSPDGATAHHYDLLGSHPISGKPTCLPEPE